MFISKRRLPDEFYDFKNLGDQLTKVTDRFQKPNKVSHGCFLE
jgi:hypothetical protein